MDAMTNVFLGFGIFPYMTDYKAQDAMLHCIFHKCRMCDTGGIGPEEFMLTLYRLYLQNWEPARTFFYMWTGKLLNPEDDLFTIVAGDKKIEFNARTINGDCDRLCCEELNKLWFDVGTGEEDESSSESQSETDSEGEGSMEYLDDSESVQSVETTDGHRYRSRELTPNFAYSCSNLYAEHLKAEEREDTIPLTTDSTFDLSFAMTDKKKKRKVKKPEDEEALD